MPPFGDQYHASSSPVDPPVVEEPATDAAPVEGVDPAAETVTVDGKEYHATGQEGVHARTRTEEEREQDAAAIGNTVYETPADREAKEQAASES